MIPSLTIYLHNNPPRFLTSHFSCIRLSLTALPLPPPSCFFETYLTRVTVNKSRIPEEKKKKINKNILSTSPLCRSIMEGIIFQRGSFWGKMVECNSIVGGLCSHGSFSPSPLSRFQPLTISPLSRPLTRSGSVFHFPSYLLPSLLISSKNPLES